MIRCPACNGETRVLETRQFRSGCRRTRRCDACNTNVTTIEVVAIDLGHLKRLITASERAKDLMTDEESGSNNPGKKNASCDGFEVVCPDGHVRHYPFHNEGDAASAANRATTKKCRPAPNPSPIELLHPPCLGGEHTVRAIDLSHLEEPS